MPIKSDAQRRAVAKYNAATYDRLELRVLKGEKDLIRTHADNQGETVNYFINRAIAETMQREGSQGIRLPEKKEG